VGALGWQRNKLKRMEGVALDAGEGDEDFGSSHKSFSFGFLKPEGGLFCVHKFGTGTHRNSMKLKRRKIRPGMMRLGASDDADAYFLRVGGSELKTEQSNESWHSCP
jgi:hypothetical protein